MRVAAPVVTLIALLGCVGEKTGADSASAEDDSGGPVVDDSGRGDSNPDDDSHGEPDTGEVPTQGPPEVLSCEEQPAPPFEWEADIAVPSGADFAFNPDGWLYSVNTYNHLVRNDNTAFSEDLLSGVTPTSGFAFIDDSTLVYTDQNAGTLMRMEIDGTLSTEADGLDSPLGLAVALDGWIYVAENGANRVSRVNLSTSTREIVSDRVEMPNGVSFSPDYETVYVSSFGDGFVYAITRDDDGQWQTRMHGQIAAMDDHGPCDGLIEGEDCVTPWGGVGACATDAAGLLECNTAARDTDACVGLAEADPCTTEVRGETIESLCTTAETGELFCPAHESWRVTACDGRAPGLSCTSDDGAPGTCSAGWEDLVVCVTNAESAAADQTCDGLAAGDACVYEAPNAPAQGTCADGRAGLVCERRSYMGGYLDGIDVDSCGNVYVAQYAANVIWQIAPDGTATEAATVPSTWFSSMHFGLGEGGFYRNVLYMLNYGQGGLFRLYTGAEGKPEPMLTE